MNSGSRLKKASYSTIMYFVYEIVLFICNLILPRLLISTYGSEYNGIVASLTQFLSFISILRLGVAGATRAGLYKPLSDNNTKSISGIVNATQKFMRKIAGIFLIYLLGLSVFYPLLVDTTYSWLEVSSLAIILGLGTFSQYFFGLTYTTLLQADQKSYIQNIFSVCSTIINTVLSCILIKCGFSIHIVKLVHSIIYSISPLLLSLYVRKKYKIEKNVEPDNTALEKKNDAMAHSVANIVHENTDVLVLTIFSNVSIVSVYSVYNLVMNGLKQFVSAFTSGLEAAFGNMLARKQLDVFNKNFELFEYLSSSLVIVLFSSTAFLIIPFVSLYTNNITDVNYVLPLYAIIVVLAQSFFCIRTPYVTVVQAAGKYKETRNGAFIEAGLNLSISIVLTIKFGIIGVAIGTLVANLFRTIQYATYTYSNLIEAKISRFYKRLLWVIVECLFIVAGLYGITNLFGIVISNWWIWVLMGFLSIFVSVLLWVVGSLIFYRKNFLGIINLLSRFLKKKRTV